MTFEELYTPRAEHLDALPEIRRRKANSDELVNLVRLKIPEQRDCYFVAEGSLARREASELSDLDFFVVAKGEENRAAATVALEDIGPQIIAQAGKSPAAGGAFNAVVSAQALLTNIGGNADDNESITRRVLLLLEGDWLSNQQQFSNLRRELLGKYIKDSIKSHQIALFMLNDFIRYYRTICVDYEFKTTEPVEKKPWGIRNIKLVFSRKLLYFSGVLAVAETAHRHYEDKVAVLERLLGLTPIDRVLAICGGRALSALALYDNFLRELSTPEVRAALNRTTQEIRDKDPTFRRLKDDGHRFSWELMSLFEATYHSSHPIHKAVFL